MESLLGEDSGLVKLQESPGDFVKYETSSGRFGYDTGYPAWSPKAIRAIETWLGQYGEVRQTENANNGPDRCKLVRWEVGGEKWYAMKTYGGNVSVFADD